MSDIISLISCNLLQVAGSFWIFSTVSTVNNSQQQPSDVHTRPTSRTQKFWEPLQRDLHAVFRFLEIVSKPLSWVPSTKLFFSFTAVTFLDLFVKSEGCNDVHKTAGTCGIAYIKVQGVERSLQSRGHNIVVVEGATGDGFWLRMEFSISSVHEALLWQFKIRSSFLTQKCDPEFQVAKERFPTIQFTNTSY